MARKQLKPKKLSSKSKAMSTHTLRAKKRGYINQENTKLGMHAAAQSVTFQLRHYRHRVARKPSSRKSSLLWCWGALRKHGPMITKPNLPTKRFCPCDPNSLPQISASKRKEAALDFGDCKRTDTCVFCYALNTSHRTTSIYLRCRVRMEKCPDRCATIWLYSQQTYLHDMRKSNFSAGFRKKITTVLFNYD